MTTQTSEMDGLRLEHRGTGKITITAEVPTEVGIENLVKELLTFLPAGSELGAEVNLLQPPHQAPYKLPGVLGQTPVPEVAL